MKGYPIMEGPKFHKPEEFMFRDLHPLIKMGTASDRYAGWIGQIYTEGRYKTAPRTHKVGGKSFIEEVLPVESVEEYFQHFPVLEIDFTFYSPLLDEDLNPTRNYQVLKTYGRYLGKTDRLILKVPQVVFAQRLWREGKHIENPLYLNAEGFTRQFYEPSIEILGDLISGFIFEQEYHPSKNRSSPTEYMEALDGFLDKIPHDDRYHLETRTDSYHTSLYFQVIQKHGVGQVLSHWTWLPPLRKQFIKAGRQFCNSGGQSMVRLMTPLRVRYEKAYEQAFPFDKIVDGMMTPQMTWETVEIMQAGIKDGICVNVIVNNRSGGNAPLIAREIATKFLEKLSPGENS